MPPPPQYQSFPDIQGDSRTLDKLKALRIPNPKGKHFLDVGCNEGFFCGFAAYHGASRVVGIDHSQIFIERARQRFPQCEFIVGSWDTLPKGPFDIILLASSLHYAEDQKKLVDSLMELLSENGILILEIGVEGSKTNEWVRIKRGVDECEFPTLPKIIEILSNYAFKYMGPSVKSSGDLIERHVFHVNHKRPLAIFLLEPPGSGKSFLTEFMFRNNPSIFIINGDKILREIGEGERKAPEKLLHLIQHNFSRQNLDIAIKNIFDRGLYNMFFQECISSSGSSSLALDMYIPQEWHEKVEEYFSKAGYLTIKLEWKNPILKNFSYLNTEQKAEEFYQFLSVSNQ